MVLRQLICGAVLVSAGCSTVDDAALLDARLAPQDAAAHAEISAVVSKALGGAAITIAPDSLVSRSALIIDPPGVDVLGRSTAKPDHFDLKTDGSACFLIHRQSGKRYRVTKVSCLAAP